MGVVSIHGDGTDISKPNQNAIELLEEMLERAKSGDICGVGIVCLHSDRSSSWWVRGQCGTFGLLGACDMVKAELMRVLEE